MKEENPQKCNKEQKKYNWKYHEKLNQKYESYLIENIDRNNLRLKGNYHYENKPLNYYLQKKESHPINNSNLTPLPQSKYLNIKTKEKNIEDYKKYSNIQKSVVEMRRMEYNIGLNKKMKKEKISEKDILEEDEENKKENKLIKRDSLRSMKNSGIQFKYSLKTSDKKRKTMKKNEIIDYIYSNIEKIEEEEDMPKEVKNYLQKLIPALIKIQKRYKKHFKNIKKIIKIQVNYRGHLYCKLYKEYSNRRKKISEFIYIIQKVLFLNLYHLKINPIPKFASNRNLYTKNYYNNKYLWKLIFLQREIKLYLSHKNLKKIYSKKKCVYIKPLTIKPLGKIRLLQKNVILFLERLKRRHTLPKSQIFFKKKIYKEKIILIQRFAKAIHEDIIHPLIIKDNFNQNNIFIKSNRKCALKKACFIDTKIIPFNPKKINMRVKIKDSKIIKFHKHLEKLIFLQRNIKMYLSREDYDIYDYPKVEEYITKDSFVLPKNDSILLLQRQIKYYLYRQKIKSKKIKKVVILPLKISKTIRTNTEKIFMRLSKLRIMYDKNLIFFIVKIIEIIKKYLGRISFDLIRKESKRKKIFSVKGGKYKNSFAKSNFIQKAVYKVVDPEYKFIPLKNEDKQSFLTKKNTVSIVSALNLGKKSDLFFNEKSKTKRSDESEDFNKKKIEEDKKE